MGPRYKYASLREAMWIELFKDLIHFLKSDTTQFAARCVWPACASAFGLFVAYRRDDPLHEWPWTVLAASIWLSQIMAAMFFGALSVTTGEAIFKFVLDRLYNRVWRIERAPSQCWERRVAMVLGVATTLVVGLACFAVFYVGVWVTPAIGPRVLSMFELNLSH
jgi:hypothetical protein